MAKKTAKDGSVEVVMLSSCGDLRCGSVVEMDEDQALQLCEAGFASMDADQIAYSKSIIPDGAL
jgi:hypothetical protein